MNRGGRAEPGISIGGGVVGNTFIGDGNRVGDVTAGGAPPDRQEVLDLVAALRTEIAAKAPATPGQDSALEVVDDLAEEMRADEPSGEVADHLMGKLTKKLVGALAVSTNVAELAEKIASVIRG
ncbi:hypothetical protein [Umezawaea beigongshangensis]|uniref:hypothetical protein n=1 Tax=Umezawaea beigongshangensis TaxID=2780383 RepID=UPI0018F24763|nr:hypothetical protein [Umezawaea beigongshangensis]